MNVLIVCSFNSGEISPFVKEQVDSLEQFGINLDYFKIEGSGIIGYLKNLRLLKQTIKDGSYDLVHAHYGLSALLANLQHIVPVVSTFHGSDINKPVNNVLSSLAGKMSDWNIYISKKLFNKLVIKPATYSIIPCGINLDIIMSMPRNKARSLLGLEAGKKYILFSSSFDRPVKNSSLAKEAVNCFEENIELIELKGYSRRQVALLMNACDLLLMTSFSEGSPQVVKEAMACGTPVISTDVGDVKEVIKNTDNCYIVNYSASEIAQKINIVIQADSRTKGRDAVQRFDNQVIANEIKKVYEKVI